MESGGLFNVLIEITKFLESERAISFTYEDVVKITGLSGSSVTKNLHRLVKGDFIIREYYYKPGVKGRFVKYTIRGVDVIRFVQEVLIGGE